ncbi:MAG: Ig-like domain-containing protein [Chloroflexota bacterium]
MKDIPSTSGSSFPKNKSRLYQVFTVLLLLSLACSITDIFRKPTPSPTPTQPVTPTLPPLTNLPPALVECDPIPGSVIPLDGAVTLYFNQPMDQPSVETALTGLPALSGQLSWLDDSTLTYTPDAPLLPNSEFVITVATSARAANGIPLTEAINVRYRTSDYLRLMQRLPEPDAREVDPTSAIVAAFNQPVVPLGETEDLPEAFTLEPEVDGRGEWLNSSTYIFYPQLSMAGGTTYHVQINPELKSTSNAPQTPEMKGESWEFTTTSPRLLSIQPSTEIPWPISAPITLTFNQPMDAQSVAANFALFDPTGSAVPGEYNWYEDFTILSFQPDRLLERETQYTLFLDKQTESNGGTPLRTDNRAVVTTVPWLWVRHSEPSEGQTTETLYQGVTLYFSAPILDHDILSSVTFDPQVPNLSYYWNEEDWSLNFYGTFAPETNYTLTASQNLRDPWDGSLQPAFTLHFRTPASEPRLYVTNVSEVLFITPNEPNLTAQATNLDKITISIGRISLDNLITLLAPGNYETRRNFIPPDREVWSHPLDLNRNQSEAVQIPLTRNRRALTPGLYFLRLSSPSLSFSPGPFPLVVSHVQLTFKLSATDALVWAVDLRDYTPVKNMPLSIYDENGKLLISGQTDNQGLFHTAIPTRQDPYSTAYAVLGKPGEEYFSMALSIWNMGVSPWDFGLAADFRPPHLYAYLYTDRPIYRPGQTVYFRAVVRNAYNGRYTLPDIQELPLTLYDAANQEIKQFHLPLSEFGTANGEYTLAEDALPGYYHFESEYGYLSFRVASYRKPEINLQVEFNASQIKAGEPLQATVDARYYFGTPAGEIPIHWALYAYEDSFYLPEYQTGLLKLDWSLPSWYQFITPLGTFLLTDSGQTNTDGTYTINLSTMVESYPNNPCDPSDTCRFILEVTIEDESGIPTSARTEVTLHPASFYIGVQPKTWIGRAGLKMPIEVQVVDWEQKPAGARTLHAKFQNVVWVREDNQAVEGFGYPTYIPQYTLIEEQDFTTNLDGFAEISVTPPEAGMYVLEISGGGAATQVLVWIGGAGNPVWPALPNQRLLLSSDRDTYRPGETAEVFLPNPFDEAVIGLLTTERGEVLHAEILTIETGGTTFELPLTAQDAPNIYLSLTLLGQMDGRPEFRQGYLNINVELEGQILRVNVLDVARKTTFESGSQADPGETLELELRVTDYKGVPVRGEFSFAAVDLATLALADPNSVDILTAFYDTQPLGVNTSLSLAAYSNRQSLLADGMGGGGGEFEPDTLREKFLDTAYWVADLVTDDKGYASISLPLPDNLTTWQIDIRGLTTDTRVGQADLQIMVTKDLLIRPITPRFFVVGDHVQLGAVIHNNTSETLQAMVELQASGFVLDDPAQAIQTVTIPPNGQFRLNWWGRVEDVDSVELIFTARAGDYQDATRPTAGLLPVLHYNTPQTFSTAGVLEEEGGRLEVISLPRTFDPSSGTLEVELAPTLASTLLAALEALEADHAYHNEAALSRFLPNLAALRAIHDLGLESPELTARLERTLDTGLEKLMEQQNEDGGWAWWPGCESDTYFTAYILFGLTQTRTLGIEIDPDILQRAAAYLQAVLPPVSALPAGPQLDRLALAHFALATAGFGEIAELSALYQQRSQLSAWAQALLALSFEQIASGDERASTLFSDLGASAIRTATGLHWEARYPDSPNLDTPLFTTAVVMFAMAQYDPTTSILSDAIRYLMTQRSPDGDWGNSYATAWSVLALSEMLKVSDELNADFNFSASLNNTQVATGQVVEGTSIQPVWVTVPLSTLFPKNPNALDIQRTAGPGRLYYRVDLNIQRPVEAVAPLNQGISLSRMYTASGDSCNDLQCPALQSAPAGELITVRLSLSLEHDLYYLLVEDYIPAGAEVLDTSLKTSQIGAVMLEYNPRRPFAEGWGWWYFHTPQIYDDHIAWAADYLPAGTYDLTYTLVLLQAGEYQVLPARARQVYFPEVQGTSGGTLFSIIP